MQLVDDRGQRFDKRLVMSPRPIGEECAGMYEGKLRQPWLADRCLDEGL